MLQYIEYTLAGTFILESILPLHLAKHFGWFSKNTALQANVELSCNQGESTFLLHLARHSRWSSKVMQCTEGPSKDLTVDHRGVFL